MVVVESAGITDVGKRRKENEDALYMDVAKGLYVLSDGMGGHRAGEVASELVVETIRTCWAGTAGGNHSGPPPHKNGSLSPDAERLMSAIFQANRKIFETARSTDSYHGMGATVSAAVFTDHTLIAANVGDSPIYLIHDGAIEMLSVTHNVVSEQASLDPGAAAQLGEDVKYLLTRAMGIERSVDPDICELPVFRGDAVVLSSDGLSDLVAPDEILHVVGSHPAERACRKLVDMANQRAGHDNITVIVVNVKEVQKRGPLARLRSNLIHKMIHVLERFA